MKLKQNKMKYDVSKVAQQLSLVFSLIFVFMATTMSSQTFADSPIRSGFNANTLAANDDSSTGLVPFGFNLNFFGHNYNQGYVNNNGNLTFDIPLQTFTPFGITNNQTKIIAPFFADVDTRVTGSNPVTYGQGSVGSRPAFGINWVGVACYSTTAGGRNTFQLVLIDRSDIGVGDFDIEFNYGSIIWETGTASGGNSICQGGNSVHVGYSNGTSSSFELVGSGIPGSFLDSNLITGLIHNSRNSVTQDGRYVFPVRNGQAPIGQSINGTVYGNDNTHPLDSALVQICTTTGDISCNITTTNPNGQYTVGGLSPNRFTVRALPPAGTSFVPASIVVNLQTTTLLGQNIILHGPQPLPNNTTIEPSQNSNSGAATVVPRVYYRDSLRLTTAGCQHGTARYSVTDPSGNVFALGGLAESTDNPGSYSTIIPPFYPRSGNVSVHIWITGCQSGTPSDVVFNMYIDPSGVVLDANNGNRPISNATVTLYRSDSSAGPFVVVPNGDSIMSPSNRTNPSLTNSQGQFGWDVISGYYMLRAQKVGCTAPGNSQQNYVDSAVLSIPPAVTDLTLTLACPIVYGVCDINRDGSVSNADITLINQRLRTIVARGAPASGDFNNDGQITSQDVRGCALQVPRL